MLTWANDFITHDKAIAMDCQVSTIHNHAHVVILVGWTSRMEPNSYYACIVLLDLR